MFPINLYLLTKTVSLLSLFFTVVDHLCANCEPAKVEGWEGEDVNISLNLLRNMRFEKVISVSANLDLAADVSKSWFSLVKKTVPTQAGWLAGWLLAGWLDGWLRAGWLAGWLAARTVGSHIYIYIYLCIYK